MRNVTDEVKNIVSFVQENCEKVGAKFGRTAKQSRLTLNMLVDIFVGMTYSYLANMSAGCILLH